MLCMLYDMNSYGLLTTLMYLSAPSAISSQLFAFYKNGTLQSSLAKDCLSSSNANADAQSIN